MYNNGNADIGHKSATFSRVSKLLVSEFVVCLETTNNNANMDFKRSWLTRNQGYVLTNLSILQPDYHVDDIVVRICQQICLYLAMHLSRQDRTWGNGPEPRPILFNRCLVVVHAMSELSRQRNEHSCNRVCTRRIVLLYWQANVSASHMAAWRGGEG